jgi:hypothetical protein
MHHIASLTNWIRGQVDLLLLVEGYGLLVERHLMKFLNLLEFLTIYIYLQN